MGPFTLLNVQPTNKQNLFLVFYFLIFVVAAFKKFKINKTFHIDELEFEYESLSVDDDDDYYY